MGDICTTCTAHHPDTGGVCHYCGTVRESVSQADPEVERALLDELHRAMAAAVHAATPGGEAPETIRDRFLRNAFIPSHAEPLVEEMVRCQQLFREEAAANTLGPRDRYRACLLRLELLAVDEVRWKPKVRILRKNLDAERKRALRSDIVIGLSVLGVIVLVIAIATYLLRGIARLWAS